MTIKDFVSKAIEGGWGKEQLYCENFDMYESSGSYCEGLTLLDPLAWQAVGKVEGWKDEWKDKALTSMFEEPWLYNMHQMIDALAEGKTIEEYINTL